MNTKRPTNSELRLGRLEGDDLQRIRQPGIFELFHRETEQDEDAPIARDDDATSSPDSPS
jgi:hypothetical protein